jgi:hypothetical protein
MIPNEDVRDQVRYIVAREARRDVILVNLSSNWGVCLLLAGRRAGTAAR